MQKNQVKLIAHVLSLLILITSVSGCSFFQFKKKETTNPRIERLPLNLQPIEPIQLESIDFIIIDKENSANVFEELQKRRVDTVLFALTDDSYKALSLNNQSVLHYILKLRDQLDAYKNYYEKNNSTKENGQ